MDEEELDAIDACAPTACSFAVQHVTGNRGRPKSTTTTPKKGKGAARIATPEKVAADKKARMEAARKRRWDAKKPD